MVDYSKMTREQIAAHVDADAHNWEWSVDEYGNDVELKYGADARYARRASQEDEDALNELLGKVYHRQLIESKPLDSDMQKILSDNIFDFF